MSKGLEVLNRIKKEQYVDGRLSLIDRVRIEIIEKELKALEIIRKCPFDLLEWAKNYDDVNNTNYYNLLKEVLL